MTMFKKNTIYKLLLNINKTTNSSIKRMSWLVIGVFCLQSIAWAAPATTPIVIPAVANIPLHFSPTVATIEEVYWAGQYEARGTKLESGLSKVWLNESTGIISRPAPRASYTNKTIFLIQDAHTNESGQMNVSKALDQIFDTYDLKYVFLEAGQGDESLSFLREYADLKQRKKVSRDYLRKGLLQGPEYFDLTTDKEVRLWGVESADLYNQALESYRVIHEARVDLENYLNQVESTLNMLQDKLYNPSLLKLNQFLRDYHQEKMSMVAYLDHLIRIANIYQIFTKDFGALNQIHALREHEKQINFDLADRERQEATKQLPLNIQKTLNLFAANKDSKHTMLDGPNDLQTNYFDTLTTSLTQCIPDYPKKYVHLSAYLEYQQLSQKLQAKAVLDQIQLLEDKVFLILSENEDEKKLIELDRVFRALKDLANLKLTPDVYQTYSVQDKLNLEFVTGFLNRKIMDLEGHYEKTLFLNTDIQVALDEAKKFYDLTLARDQVFIQQTLAKMSAAGENQAVLITGGYHSPNLKQLLKNQGINYISILPTIYQPTDHARYERLLLNQTPFSVRQLSSKTVLDTSNKLNVTRMSSSPNRMTAFLRELISPGLVTKASEMITSRQVGLLQVFTEVAATRMADDVNTSNELPEVNEDILENIKAAIVDLNDPTNRHQALLYLERNFEESLPYLLEYRKLSDNVRDFGILWFFENTTIPWSETLVKDLFEIEIEKIKLGNESSNWDWHSTVDVAIIPMFKRVIIPEAKFIQTQGLSDPVAAILDRLNSVYESSGVSNATYNEHMGIQSLVDLFKNIGLDEDALEQMYQNELSLKRRQIPTYPTNIKWSDFPDQRLLKEFMTRKLMGLSNRTLRDQSLLDEESLVLSVLDSTPLDKHMLLVLWGEDYQPLTKNFSKILNGWLPTFGEFSRTDLYPLHPQFDKNSIETKLGLLDKMKNHITFMSDSKALFRLIKVWGFDSIMQWSGQQERKKNIFDDDEFWSILAVFDRPGNLAISILLERFIESGNHAFIDHFTTLMALANIEWNETMLIDVIKSISMNPKRVTPFIAYLITYFTLRPITLQDDSKIHEAISQLLYSDFGSDYKTYFLVRQFIKTLPFFRSDIEESRAIRKLALRLDEKDTKESRRDPLFRYLRLKIHRKSDSGVKDFVQAYLLILAQEVGIENQADTFDSLAQFADPGRWDAEIRPGLNFKKSHTLSQIFRELMTVHLDDIKTGRVDALNELVLLSEEDIKARVSDAAKKMDTSGFSVSDEDIEDLTLILAIYGKLLVRYDDKYSSTPEEKEIETLLASNNTLGILTELNQIIQERNALQQKIKTAAVWHDPNSDMPWPQQKTYSEQHIAPEIVNKADMGYGNIGYTRAYTEERFDALQRDYALSRLESKILDVLLAKPLDEYIEHVINAVQGSYSTKTLTSNEHEGYQFFIQLLAALMEHIHLDGLSDELTIGLSNLVLTPGLTIGQFMDVLRLVNESHLYLLGDVDQNFEKIATDTAIGIGSRHLGNFEDVGETFRMNLLASEESLPALAEYLTKLGSMSRELESKLNSSATTLKQKYLKHKTSDVITTPQSFSSGSLPEQLPSAAFVGSKAKGLMLADGDWDIPPYFVLTASTTSKLKRDPNGQKRLRSEIIKNILLLEKQSEKRFPFDEAFLTEEEKNLLLEADRPKSSSDVLLVSVRSGSAISMPGMMGTVLYAPMSRQLVDVFTKRYSRRTAMIFLSNLYSQYGEVAYNIQTSVFIEAQKALKSKYSVSSFNELPTEAIVEMVDIFEQLIRTHLEDDDEVPLFLEMDALSLLVDSANRVYESWDSEEATEFRRLNGVSDDWGTAVIIQEMRYSDVGPKSATAVVSSRDPDSGERVVKGAIKFESIGDALVAGTSKNKKLMAEGLRSDGTSLQAQNPDLYNRISEIVERLDYRFGPVEVELAIEEMDDGYQPISVLQIRRLAPMRGTDYRIQNTRQLKPIGVGQGLTNTATRGRALFVIGLSFEKFGEKLFDLAGEYPDDKFILVTDYVTPIIGIEVNNDKVSGFMSIVGGTGAHALMITKSSGKAAVGDINLNAVKDGESGLIRYYFGDIEIKDGDPLVIDAHSSESIRTAGNIYADNPDNPIELAEVKQGDIIKPDSSSSVRMAVKIDESALFSANSERLNRVAAVLGESEFDPFVQGVVRHHAVDIENEELMALYVDEETTARIKYKLQQTESGLIVQASVTLNDEVIYAKNIDARRVVQRNERGSIFEVSAVDVLRMIQEADESIAAKIDQIPIPEIGQNDLTVVSWDLDILFKGHGSTSVFETSFAQNLVALMKKRAESSERGTVFELSGETILVNMAMAIAFDLRNVGTDEFVFRKDDANALKRIQESTGRTETVRRLDLMDANAEVVLNHRALPLKILEQVGGEIGILPFKSILAFAEKAAQVDLANPAQATALKAAYEVLIGKSIDRDTFIAILTGKADVNTRLEYGIPELAKFPINILIQAAQTQARMIARSA